MSQLRPASLADLPSLRSLYEARDGASYDDAAVLRRLGDLDPERARTELAVIDGRVVAMSTVLFRPLAHGRATLRAAYWTDLFVDEAYRRHALYVPLARATLAHAREGGAELTLTGNRRRDVWSTHTKLGFRIASAIPTRARPIRPLGFAYRMALGETASSLATPIDRLAMRLVDRVAGRAPADTSIRVDERPAEDAAYEALLPLLARARGRLVGTPWTLERLRERYAMPLEGRPYRVLLARREGAIVGAAVVRTARRGRFEAAVVLELLDGGRPEIGRALVHGVEAWASARHADLVLALDGAPELGSLWDDVGYVVTPEHYVVLVHPAERLVDPGLGAAPQWRFPFAEHDAF